MSAEDIKTIECERQALLGQLNAAEASLRSGLHTEGFGSIARAHMERARAHICEAYIAINEPAKHARSVHQLVDDLNRVQQLVDDVRRRQGKSIGV